MEFSFVRDKGMFIEYHTLKQRLLVCYVIACSADI